MDGEGWRTVLGNYRSMKQEFPVRGSLRPGNAAFLIFVFWICLPLSFSSARAARLQTAPKSNAASLQELELKYEKATVGANVRVSAAGLPAGETVELKWSTVTGGWVIQDYYYFRGRKYSETNLSLGEFIVSANGHLDASFAIPEDYGGVHDVIATIDGKVVAQNGVEVTQSFDMTPTSGPIGTAIELRVKGLGWRPMENTWVVDWDNRGIGFVTAAGTRGSAIARFRAAGPSGDHFVKVYTGWQGQSYLNYQQAPNAYLPRPDFTFHTTSGSSSTPAAYADEYKVYSLPEPEVHIVNGKLSLSSVQGPSGAETVLCGEGFPADSTLDLFWQTYIGSRVSGSGFAPEEKLIAKVKVGKDGKFNAPLTIPQDLGGEHGIEIREGDKLLGRAYYAIETTIVSMEPTSGPAGTPITIHLKGVGWTEYDNLYVATYDNAYMGYVCGFNSQGDVEITFKAAGGAGIHVIDFFPGIYQGPPTENQLLYRMPQLTYADDHPGNKIPALHFNFDVTP
jgi:hypothetical protein